MNYILRGGQIVDRVEMGQLLMTLTLPETVNLEWTMWVKYLGADAPWA